MLLLNFIKKIKKWREPLYDPKLYDGHLFREVAMIGNAGEMYPVIHYYAFEGGNIFSINQGTNQRHISPDDTLTDLVSQCEDLGPFDQSKIIYPDFGDVTRTTEEIISFFGGGAR